MHGLATSLEEAMPLIVFPGRVGVDRVRTELIARGLEDVRTLRNLDGTSPEADDAATVGELRAQVARARNICKPEGGFFHIEIGGVMYLVTLSATERLWGCAFPRRKSRAYKRRSLPAIA